MSDKTMILVRSSWNNTETMRMVPVTENCPYVECIWDPENKVFVIISKVTKTTMHMLPKLDDNGDPIAVKVPRPNGRTIREERKTIETFQEYYLEDKNSIKDIINMHAVNNDSFDWSSFLQAEEK